MTLSGNDMSAAQRAIQDHHRILITPHANVDPDGLSSALACFQLFTALGKEVTVICPDTLPDTLDFLPGFEKLTQDVEGNENFVITVNLQGGVEVDKLRYTVEDNKVNIIVVPKNGKIQPDQVSLAEGEKKYDLLVVVDTADLPLLGSVYTDHIDLFSSVPILNIDHHISNVKFGQLQLIDPTAASATEVLYSWFMSVPEWKKMVNPDIATLLLTGLITDTRSFQNPNTTPRSLEIAAELLELGARQQEIIEHIYKTKPLSTLKIWGRALNAIQVDAEAGIVWSAISKEDLAEMGATSKETSGILDELISTIPDADVHVLFTEIEDGTGLKASMRSSPAINVSTLASKAYGGGGHARAAGFKMKEFSNFSVQVLECVQKLKEGMALQRNEINEPLPDQQTAPAAPQEPVQETIAQPQEPVQPAAPQPSVDVVESVADAPAPSDVPPTDVVQGLTEDEQK